TTTPLVGINSRSHMDSPGIDSSRPEGAHRILQILLPYLTSNMWFAAKVNTLKLPVIYPTKFRIYLSSYTNHRHSILLCRILATGMNIYLPCKVGV
ncbi:hypothetical protein, partial [Salmonella enterica]|uniref:hypothetical protein n=1 Tax=Salmonella enterica TaxID=28901 RepID=UPI0022860BBD